MLIFHKPSESLIYGLGFRALEFRELFLNLPPVGHAALPVKQHRSVLLRVLRGIDGFGGVLAGFWVLGV